MTRQAVDEVEARVVENGRGVIVAGGGGNGGNGGDNNSNVRNAGTCGASAVESRIFSTSEATSQFCVPQAQRDNCGRRGDGNGKCPTIPATTDTKAAILTQAEMDPLFTRDASESSSTCLLMAQVCAKDNLTSKYQQK